MEIRRLRRGDGGWLRDVRLRAFTDAPYAFSSSMGREVELGPEFWEQRAAESDLAEDGVVFVAIEDERSVGMAGGFFVAEEPSIVMLWGMWADPQARQSGVGHSLVEAVASWRGTPGPIRCAWR